MRPCLVAGADSEQFAAVLLTPTEFRELLTASVSVHASVLGFEAQVAMPWAACPHVRGLLSIRLGARGQASIKPNAFIFRAQMLQLKLLAVPVKPLPFSLDAATLTDFRHCLHSPHD